MMLRNFIEAAEERLIAVDAASQEFFQPYTDAAPMKVLDVVSKLGDQPELRAIASAIVLAGVAADSDRMVRAGARMLIAHETATLAKKALKTNVDRTRPRSADTRRQKKPRKGKHTTKELTSFPSGHTAGSIAVARAFSREYPEYGAAALAVAGLIGALQVPRSAHYPSDVAAGLAIGLAAEAATNFLWDLARMNERSRGKR
ncbi:membrane-associated phospholipid phosphatase [Sphingomonas sp. F9_3S_D5_B_2]